MTLEEIRVVDELIKRRAKDNCRVVHSVALMYAFFLACFVTSIILKNKILHGFEIRNNFISLILDLPVVILIFFLTNTKYRGLNSKGKYLFLAVIIVILILTLKF
jgi:hypothetical protein